VTTARTGRVETRSSMAGIRSTSVMSSTVIAGMVAGYRRSARVRSVVGTPAVVGSGRAGQSSDVTTANQWGCA
jgi:hypothetical protein